MSLRIVPPASHPKTYAATSSSNSAPSVPGLVDPLRSRLQPEPPSSSTSSTTTTTTNTTSTHPLEARLKSWAATQEALRMESLRRTFGIAEPVRRGMEMRIVRAGEWRPACLGGSTGVGMDVLRGAEWGELAWEDIYGGDELREPEDFHTEMERRLRMNW